MRKVVFTPNHGEIVDCQDAGPLVLREWPSLGTQKIEPQNTQNTQNTQRSSAATEGQEVSHQQSARNHSSSRRSLHPEGAGLPRCAMTTNSQRLLQFQRQRWNHGTHGTHGKEQGGNRWDGGDFPRVTEPVSETFASHRDSRMTQRFLSFSVYSVCSVVPHSGLGKDIRTRQRAEVNDPEPWVGESDSVVFAPRKPWG